MDYDLTEVQQEIVKTSRQIAQKKIKPVREHYDKTEEFAWPIVDQRPDLVRANVAVEPNGPPVREAEFKGGKVVGLGTQVRNTGGRTESSRVLFRGDEQSWLLERLGYKLVRAKTNLGLGRAVVQIVPATQQAVHA